MAGYLNTPADFITAELMQQMREACPGMAEEELFAELLSSILGLDQESSEEDRIIHEKYIRPGIHRLDPEFYRSDPYFKNIAIPQATFGRWELGTEQYKAYEPFVCGEAASLEDGREIPQLGYFDEDFVFPAIRENGREWMAIKPNEIETVRREIAMVKGHLLTFGLGMGYFAYMASEKPEIERVTVIERGHEEIELFKKFILPQFPQKEKIEIIEGDAFEWLDRNLASVAPNFVFADLWHDISDGVPLYIAVKAREHLSPSTKFLYWIEQSILSALRNAVE